MARKTYSGTLFVTVEYDNVAIDGDNGATLADAVGGQILDDLRAAVALLRDQGKTKASYDFSADLRVLDVASDDAPRVDEPL